jgi:hypothetical protein
MLRYRLPPGLFDPGTSNELVNFGHIQTDSELQMRSSVDFSRTGYLKAIRF